MGEWKKEDQRKSESVMMENLIDSPQEVKVTRMDTTFTFSVLLSFLGLQEGYRGKKKSDESA